jgi:hypothetical protein
MSAEGMGLTAAEQASGHGLSAHALSKVVVMPRSDCTCSGRQGAKQRHGPPPHCIG